MVSVIICSRSKHEAQEVALNIAALIGVTHEFIRIDNSEGKYSICEAYNIGAAQAQYSLLCFMHEDIRLHTIGWGKIIAIILSDPTIGVLGITGGLRQVAAPAPWWGCGLELCRENVLNVFPDGHKEMELRNPEKATLVDAAVVDGMWMCSRKEVWQRYPFDEKTFKDFHFYDVDYCTELFSHGLRVCITFEVLLEHHSRGSVNDMWVRNALKYKAKWQGQLPFGPVAVPAARQRQLEMNALQEFTGRLIRGKFPLRVVARYLRQCLILEPLNRDTLWLLKDWLRRGLANGSLFDEEK